METKAKTHRSLELTTLVASVLTVFISWLLSMLSLSDLRRRLLPETLPLLACALPMKLLFEVSRPEEKEASVKKNDEK